MKKILLILMMSISSVFACDMNIQETWKIKGDCIGEYVFPKTVENLKTKKTVEMSKLSVKETIILHKKMEVSKSFKDLTLEDGVIYFNKPQKISGLWTSLALIAIFFGVTFLYRKANKRKYYELDKEREKYFTALRESQLKDDNVIDFTKYRSMRGA